MWCLLAVLVAADAPPAVKWATAVERNAVKLKESANQLADTAGRIAGEGRISHLAPLRSEAEEVVRRAEALVRSAGEELPR